MFSCKLFISFIMISLSIGVAMAIENAKNILGEPLEQCSTQPLTGFYRDGYCNTGNTDIGSHVVAAIITDEFLEFTKSRNNDLTTPRPALGFPGLKAGDRWCLCALRWKEAHDAGFAPSVILEATHEKALVYIPFEILKTYQAQ
jgi:uncharacterized protein (DUF2237 family)